MRITPRSGLLVALIVLAPALAEAQGYDARWNANYRPPVPTAPGGASAQQLWQAGLVYLDRGDYRDALPYVQRCAQMADVHCEAEMGILHQSNDIGPRNDQQAALWFQRAAAQGHRAAEYELGAMYDEGEGGLPRDLAKAIALYRASAAQGFPSANLILAVDSEMGEGLPRSRSTAIAYARRAGGAYGNLIVRALSNPQTPRFANDMRFGQYLARLDNADFARSWAAAMSPYDKGGGGETMERLMIENWRRSAGGAEPVGAGPP